MTRINSNIPALVSQRQLGQAQARLSTTLERLATGLRINHGSDDPAGLIVSETLRSEIAATRQAVNNSQRASNVVATTEAALDEVSKLLNDVQNLVVEAANRGAISDDEIRANQLQIDSAVESISRIANTTTFAGRKLLDGSLDYILSGVSNSQIESLEVVAATFGNQSHIPVTVQVTQSAQHGELFFATSQIGQSISIEVAGNNGVVSLSFISGTTASAILAAINVVSDASGVDASLINPANAASGIVLQSQGYGSDSFVQVNVLPTSHGTFSLQDAAGGAVSRDTGRDAAATINGATSIGRGRELILNTAGLNVALTITEAFNHTGTTSFAITGGGALFQLGPGINTNQQVNLGVRSIAASRLGTGTIGFLSQVTTGQQYSLVNGEAEQAAKIISEALRQVSLLRGRLGAFEKNTLNTNVSQLQITLENLTSSESSIRDADFAAETSDLTRNQILVQAGTSVLALANSTPQSVLALLRQ